jgi:hypothetical protein
VIYPLCSAWCQIVNRDRPTVRPSSMNGMRSDPDRKGVSRAIQFCLRLWSAGNLIKKEKELFEFSPHNKDENDDEQSSCTRDSTKTNNIVQIHFSISVYREMSELRTSKTRKRNSWLLTCGQCPDQNKLCDDDYEMTSRTNYELSFV